MGVKNKNNCSVYAIDFNNSSVNYYAINTTGHVIHDARQLSAKLFTQEYYDKLTAALKEFSSKYAPATADNTTIVFPDSCVFTNCVTFPTLYGSEAKSSYNAYIANMYKNNNELKIIPYKVVSTKQYYTTSLVGINTKIIENIKYAFVNAKIIANNFTFASNATISALFDLIPQYKNDSYLFLDIKKQACNYILVHKGRVLSFFSMPFGYDILETKPAAEDVLLYNQTSELVVVNARELAKQKALTMLGTDTVTDMAQEDTELEDNDDFDDNPFAGTDTFVTNTRPQQETIKTLPKKVARKLPKFMQRDIPDDDEGKIYENFRIFIKWALELINNNEKMISFVKPNKVVVNVPSRFNYLFDMANEEEDNGIKFSSAGLNKVKEEIAENLELYGGLFAKDNKQSILF